MKCISLKQPWANWVRDGLKTLESRTWPTHYRGDLVICSSKSPSITPAGCAIAVVRVAGCVRMSMAHEREAMCPTYTGAYVWKLTNRRVIVPEPVRGQMGIFDAILDAIPDRHPVPLTACPVCGSLCRAMRPHYPGDGCATPWPFWPHCPTCHVPWVPQQQEAAKVEDGPGLFDERV